MSMLSTRLLGLAALLGAALITYVAVAGLSSGAGHAARGSDTDGCTQQGGAIANVAYTPGAVDKTCAGQDTQGIEWTYQLMSTDRSHDNPYVGSPQQQWLAAGAFAAGLAGLAAVRRRLLDRARVSGR